MHGVSRDGRNATHARRNADDDGRLMSIGECFRIWYSASILSTSIRYWKLLLNLCWSFKLKKLTGNSGSVLATWSRRIGCTFSGGVEVWNWTSVVTLTECSFCRPFAKSKLYSHKLHWARPCRRSDPSLVRLGTHSPGQHRGDDCTVAGRSSISL